MAGAPRRFHRPAERRGLAVPPGDQPEPSRPAEAPPELRQGQAPARADHQPDRTARAPRHPRREPTREVDVSGTIRAADRLCQLVAEDDQPCRCRLDGKCVLQVCGIHWTVLADELHPAAMNDLRPQPWVRVHPTGPRAMGAVINPLGITWK